MTRPSILTALVVAGGALSACDDAVAIKYSALSRPIDFTWACEGDGATTGAVVDESAADIKDATICSKLASGADAALFGLVLNRAPASVSVAQLSTAYGERRFLDASFFVPGTSGIPTPMDPLRIIKAPDSSSFFVLAGGDGALQRLQLKGLSGDTLDWEAHEAPLPGPPVDATFVGEALVVAARDEAALWVYADPGAGDWADGAPKPLPVALPGRALSVTAIDGRLLVVWRDWPRLSVVGLDGAVLADAGLVPACRDGLDDDGDGLVDGLDPDCLDRDDDDESGATGAPREELPEVLPAAFAGAAACDNGVDDDGDGVADAADPDCLGGDARAEALPACANGVDDDGDGVQDGEDPDCIHAAGLSEGPPPRDGSFSLTVVDGGAAGRFAYVLDARRGELLVFALGDVGGAAPALTRVDVHAADSAPPAFSVTPFGDAAAEPTVKTALPAVRQPAFARNNRKNIIIPSGNPFSLSTSRLRGEVWERLVDLGDLPREASATLWRPASCDADSPPGRCARPAGDDASWLVLGAAIDGRIQLIEAIRRGTPVHRILPRQPDVAKRTHEISEPRLSRRGAVIASRAGPGLGQPTLGPAAQESIADAVAGVSAQRVRRYGIWPAEDFEATPTEAWSLTYEGVVPRAEGRFGAFADEVTLIDPAQRFCEHGVRSGDWLQLEVPVASASPALARPLVPSLADGRACPTRPIATTLVEVRVTEVGMARLGFDPATVRLRPQLPTLDEAAVAAAGLSLRLCQVAVEALDATLGTPQNLLPPADGELPLGPALLPERVRYRVRVAEAWAAVGAASGFLHRQRWDRTDGRCVEDDSLDPRLSARAVEVPGAVERYATCPPTSESLAIAGVDAILAGAERFTNPSFALDVFPPCAVTPEGRIISTPTQQDTAFAFTVTGPLGGSALSLTDSMLQARVPVIDALRQQVQLDAGRNRLGILQLRFGELKEIVTLE